MEKIVESSHDDDAKMGIPSGIGVNGNEEDIEAISRVIDTSE